MASHEHLVSASSDSDSNADDDLEEPTTEILGGSLIGVGTDSICSDGGNVTSTLTLTSNTAGCCAPGQSGTHPAGANPAGYVGVGNYELMDMQQLGK